MRIAIASSGLGHVARGIETWALDTAVALAEVKRETLDVKCKTLDVRRSDFGDAIDVTLFAAALLPHLTSHASHLTIHVLPSLKRGDPLTQFLTRILPGFTWRWGLKSTYDLEQWSFWRHLWPKLRRGKFDLVHVQDPWLARLLDVSGRWGLHKAKVILAHGTEEPLEFLEKFEYVQHLAPWHLSEAQNGSRQGAGSSGQRAGGRGPCVAKAMQGKQWTAMPNFVDCAVFHPVQSPSEKQALRTSLGLPPDAFIVGCVAAVKKDHKRIDYLIHEFALYYNGGEERRRKKFEQKHAKHAKEENGFSAEGGEENSSLRSSRASVQNSSLFLPYLLIAGAKTSETPELLALAESLIPGRYKILTDCSRARMPDLLRAMDVFVLTSLFEMMPIALLEALASGLPCLVNTHPVLEWMIGAGEDVLDVRRETLDADRRASHISRLTPHASPLPGGVAIDMSKEGALAEALAGLTPEWLILHGRQARERALQMFSAEAVIDQYVAYYEEILGMSGKT